MESSYSELLKDPIKNREQLLAMDRAIERRTVGNYTTSINGLEINENTSMFEIYNHIGIPSEPYVIHTHKRLPRKMKKRIKKHNQVTAGGILTAMFGNAIQSAERHEAKRSDAIQKRLNEIKAVHEKVSK